MQIGTITALNRFPVKSMRAEALPSAEVTWNGLLGDRRYAFVKSANRSRFPWLTGRDIFPMVLHRAEFTDPANVAASRIRVTAPDGWEGMLDDPELTARLSQQAGEDVHLIQIGRGTFDAMPISVVTEGTQAAVAEAHGSDVGLGRFRINLVVRAVNSKMRETDWFGSTLVIGEGAGAVRLRVDAEVLRCAMVTLDPNTARQDVSVLRTVAQRFDNCVGAYCTPETTGPIEVGAPVRLERS
jgi:uncharacterized protein YcbX